MGLALVFATARLAAQGTAGKIEGTVRDASGAPIAGATVLIVGSSFSSTTNEQGYYFINNVPAGLITVRGQYIGYAPAEARGVRVLAGQTMTVPLQLTPQTVQVEGITVEVVANPIVPRDQVASKPIINGDLVHNLPVTSIQDALRLQPGVVESNRGLSIRGGRVGEAPTYIDGVEVRSVSGRTGTATVGTDALEEASVTTGAIGATQGDAQAGVISLVTRSGGQRFTPFLRFESDGASGVSHGQGLNHLEASLGGPLAHNLTFFVSTLMEGRQTNQLLGKGMADSPLYVLNGVDTTVTVPVTAGSTDSERINLPAFARYSNGLRRPNNWGNDWNLDGKVTYSYGSGS
ncbi:MAG TPA: TonB-dependent receptor, partial [Mycobacterium sp.]|nr:TonB-dependent receptor [Mycobacterium sp.]